MKLEKPSYKSPYDGTPFDLVMLGISGRFFPRDLFDPGQPFDSKEAAEAALFWQRDGKPRKKATARCPYSGRTMKIVENERDGKFYMRGGFNPIKPYPNRHAAEFALSIRYGTKPTFPEQPPKVEVNTPEPPHPSTVDDLQHKSDKINQMIQEI